MLIPGLCKDSVYLCEHLLPIFHTFLFGAGSECRAVRCAVASIIKAMFSSFGAVTKEEPSNKVHLLRSSHAYVEQNRQTNNMQLYRNKTAHDGMTHNISKNPLC